MSRKKKTEKEMGRKGSLEKRRHPSNSEESDNDRTPTTKGASASMHQKQVKRARILHDEEVEDDAASSEIEEVSAPNDESAQEVSLCFGSIQKLIWY
jgi:hypothetical protein